MNTTITISETIEEIPASNGFTYDVEIDVEVGFMCPDREVGYSQPQVTVDDWKITNIHLYDNEGQLVLKLENIKHCIDELTSFQWGIDLNTHIQKWVDDNNDMICEDGAEEYNNKVSAAQETAAESHWERQQEDRWEKENGY